MRLVEGSRRRVVSVVLWGAGCCALYTAVLITIVCLLDPVTADVLRGFPSRAVHATTKALSSWDSVTGRPGRLDIRIEEEDFERIRADRRRALENRFNDSDLNAWVPAKMDHAGESVKVRLRLKGALRDHWEHPQKWSFLIKVRGDDAIKGLKRFSIQHPSTRSFIYEWLFMRALEDEGLISHRFEFIEVYINGKNRGLYALEEQAGKRLIENNGLREGPILGFDKSDWLAYWIAHAEFARIGNKNLGNPDPSWFFKAAPIEASQTGSVLPDSPDERLHVEAMTLLEAFRSGRREASEVFEGEEMAKLAALFAAFGALELDWRDLRYYYNPLTARLHPIGKELHHDRAIGAHRWWTNDGERPHGAPLPKRLFADPEFERVYVRQLDRFSKREWLESFFERHDRTLARNLSFLEHEFPNYEFSREDLRAIGNVIRNMLRPARTVNAYLARVHEGEIQLEIGNLHAFTVHVIGARLPGGLTLPVGETTVLRGRKMDDVVTHRTVMLQAPFDWSPELAAELNVVVQVPGLDDEFVEPVFQWPRSTKTDLESDVVRELPASIEREFLVVTGDTGEIHCRQGAWVIDEPLVIPPGYRLMGGPGVRWDLRDSAFVLSYSPVELVGSEDAPFVIESTDSTGCGLVVLNAAADSRLEYVSARDLSPPNRDGWSLTGAITFFASPVRIKDAVFADNRGGDDALNLFQSDFLIERSVFVGTVADALDLDYCTGKIQDTRFEDVGNDAIDTSGSHVEVVGVNVAGAGDKGMSFGEGSRASVRDATISKARIGLASKDDSVVNIFSSAIHDSEYGLALYQKKPEFGPGTIEAVGLALSGNRTESVVEHGSTLTVNNEKQATEFANVAGMLNP